jgi:hypothetical protein
VNYDVIDRDKFAVVHPSTKYRPLHCGELLPLVLRTKRMPCLRSHLEYEVAVILCLTVTRK